jgi:DNA processing protein
MARGIDSAAHQGALKAGGKTFAVLGCGADIIYPAENINIYKKTIDCGAIISEYLPGIKPLASNFPSRNRIISGLVKGILVAESSFKGGANITVKCAIDQGREVMAVPCSPYDIRAELPNDIIKNGGLLVQSASDILSEFGWVQNNRSDERVNKINLRLDFFEQQIYNLLLQGELTIDQLLEVVDFQQSDLFISLTMLEMKQVVLKKPGNIYSIKCFISER